MAIRLKHTRLLQASHRLMFSIKTFITDVDATINPPTNPGTEIGEGEPKLLWPHLLVLFVFYNKYLEREFPINVFDA